MLFCSVLFGSVRFCSVLFGSVRFCSVLFGSVLSVLSGHLCCLAPLSKQKLPSARLGVLVKPSPGLKTPEKEAEERFSKSASAFY